MAGSAHQTGPSTWEKVDALILDLRSLRLQGSPRLIAWADLCEEIEDGLPMERPVLTVIQGGKA
jgi:hypothetical protein